MLNAMDAVIAESLVCGCRGKECPICVRRRGLRLRSRLLSGSVAASFWRPHLITLARGDGDLAALETIKKKREVGEFMRSLTRKGRLINKAYFAVIDFWEDSFTVRVLVDAKWLPIAEVRRCWKGQVIDVKPVASAAIAIHEVTGGVVSEPHWPSWIDQAGSRMRYFVSRGFWS